MEGKGQTGILFKGRQLAAVGGAPLQEILDPVLLAKLQFPAVGKRGAQVLRIPAEADVHGRPHLENADVKRIDLLAIFRRPVFAVKKSLCPDQKLPGGHVVFRKKMIIGRLSPGFRQGSENEIKKVDVFGVNRRVPGGKRRGDDSEGR